MTLTCYKENVIYRLERKEKTTYLFHDVFGNMQIFQSDSDDTMMNIKTYDKDPVFVDYNTDPNVGFGTGTDNSSRFGKREEIIYTNVPIKFTINKAIDRGVDRATVNANFEEAIKGMVDQTLKAYDREASIILGKGIVEKAKNKVLSVNDILEAFQKAMIMYTNSKFDDLGVAYVSPEAYAALLEHPKLTVLKHSAVNIDKSQVLEVYGFRVIKVSKNILNGNDIVFAPTNSGVYAVVVRTARLVEPLDFDGHAFQMHIKGGFFLPSSDSFRELIILGKLTNSGGNKPGGDKPTPTSKKS